MKTGSAVFSYVCKFAILGKRDVRIGKVESGERKRSLSFCFLPHSTLPTSSVRNTQGRGVSGMVHEGALYAHTLWYERADLVLELYRRRLTEVEL